MKKKNFELGSAVVKYINGEKVEALQMLRSSDSLIVK